MNIGDKIHFTRDDKHPIESIQTDLMVAWSSCGGEIANYRHSIEKMPDGTNRREVVWSTKDINVIIQGEEIGFQEFRRRFYDKDWCEANPEHAISYLAAFSANKRQAMALIKSSKPFAQIRKGNKIAFLHPDDSQAKKEFILREMGV